MKINFVAKNYSASAHLKEIIEKKLEKLAKFFDKTVGVKVMLKEEGAVFKLELTIVMGGVIFRSEAASDDMFKNVDFAAGKLEKQVTKHFSRMDSKNKKGNSPFNADMSMLPECKEARVVRTKTFNLSPISVKQAMDEIERIEHDFYVFLNEQTKKVNILYLRDNGDYGIIEAII